MPANRPATDRTQSLRPLFSWMTSTPPRAFGASAHAACSSPCGPAQVIGVVVSALSDPRRCARSRWQLRWRSPARSRWACCFGCFRCRRRSGRWPPRRSPPAVPAGAGLRVGTTGRRRDRWQFLRRYSAVRVSRSRVCPYGLDYRMRDALRGRVAVVAGATRGAGRGIAAALGEAGATVICTGRSSVSRQRAVRLRPSGNHRRDRANWSRTRRRRHPDPGRPPRHRAGAGPRRAHPGRLRRHRHPGQRHLGRRGAQGSPADVEQADLGTRPRRRAADPAARHRHPPHHLPLPAAAAGRAARRPARRSDRRDKGIQRPHLPDLGVLRPGEGRGEPARLQPRPRARSASAPPPSPSRRAGCARR